MYRGEPSEITKKLVQRFEAEQKQHGTAVALHNILWQVGYDLFKDLGVIGIKTKYRKGK